MPVRIFRVILTIPVFVLLCVTNASGIDLRPLSFSDAADLAVSASAELRTEYNGLKLMESSWRLGFRNYLPQIGLSAQENDRLQEIGQDSFIKNYGVSLEQLLWDGGKLLMSRRLERMELNLSNARLERMAGDIAESAVFT
jgi:outer membrane protein TolC